MSDKAEKKPDAKDAKPAAAAPPAEAHGEEKKGAKAKGGLLKSTPVILGGIMLLEAVVLFADFKFIGAGAKNAHAADLAAEPGHDAPAGEHGEADPHGGGGGGAAAKPDKKKVVEIPVVKFRATNSRRGRTVHYDVRIVALAKSENQEKITGLIKDREATLQDRIRTIIAQCDPEKLGGGSEPGLETLRRQVKYQLDELFGEGMIDEVLVTDCTPFRSDL